MGWFSIVYTGSTYSFAPRGPRKSVEEAKEALSNYRRRLGTEAGTEFSIANPLVLGPYPTRETARGASVDDVMHRPEFRRAGAEKAHIN